MTRQILYIHIGHYKTGTSALQLFCKLNRIWLRFKGIDYPYLAPDQAQNAKQSEYAFCLYRAAGVQTLMHGYDDPTPPRVIWGQLFDHIRASGAARTLISSEEFARLGAYPAAGAELARIRALAPDIDIRIIAYLRPPHDHLRAWYNQLIKMQVPVADFNTALRRQIEPIHWDYGLMLRPWIEIFGAQNIILRPYSDALRQGKALYRSFMSVFDLNLPDLLISVPKEDPNPRLDDRVLDVMRVSYGAGLPLPMTKLVAERMQAFLTQQDTGLAPGGAESGIPIEQIVAECRAGLEGVRALPGSTLDLAPFLAALPQPETAETLALRQQIGFLMTEINRQRYRMNLMQADFETRLTALEQAVAAAPPRTGQPEVTKPDGRKVTAGKVADGKVAGRKPSDGPARARTKGGGNTG